MAGQLTFYLGFLFNYSSLVFCFAKVGEETSIIRSLIFCFAKRFLPLLCIEAVFTAETRDLLVTKRLFCIISIFGRGTFKFRGMEASLVTNGHKKMISTPWISNLLGLGSPSSIHSLKRVESQMIVRLSYISPIRFPCILLLFGLIKI